MMEKQIGCAGHIETEAGIRRIRLRFDIRIDTKTMKR